MADAGIGELPLYHEDRPCKAPTAARVLELADPLACSVVSHRGQVLTVVARTLSTLQEQIPNLSMLASAPTARSHHGPVIRPEGLARPAEHRVQVGVHAGPPGSGCATPPILAPFARTVVDIRALRVLAGQHPLELII